jgi:flagellar hook-length control protein FliK
MLNAVNLVMNTPPAPSRGAPDSAPAGEAPDGFARAIAKARLAEREQNRQLQRAAQTGSKAPQERAAAAAEPGPGEQQSVAKPADAPASADRDVAARDRPVSADTPAAMPTPLPVPVPVPDHTGRAAPAMDPAHAQGAAAAFAQRGMATAAGHNTAMQRVQAALEAHPAVAAAAKKLRGPGDENFTLPVPPNEAASAQAGDSTPGEVLPGPLATFSPGHTSGGGEAQPPATRDHTGRRVQGQGLAFERQDVTKAGETVAARHDAKAEDTRAVSATFSEIFKGASSEAGANPGLFGAPVASGTVSTSATTPNPQAQATLSARLDSEAFGAQASQQIAVFVRDGIHTARLNLNPAEMGPVTVQIQLDGLNAQVHLAAEQGLTRQALEQSMPMLASQLRESGLTLTGGGVFEQPRQTAQDSGQGQNSNNPRGNVEAGNARPYAFDDRAGPGGPAAGGKPGRRARGIVDLVA